MHWVAKISNCLKIYILFFEKKFPQFFKIQKFEVTDGGQYLEIYTDRHDKLLTFTAFKILIVIWSQKKVEN